MSKFFSVVLVAGAVLSAIPAKADFRMGRTRPLYKAELQVRDGQKVYPSALSVTLNNKDGFPQKYTSVTLVEDTGVRCITTPCPSEKTSEFEVLPQPDGVRVLRNGQEVIVANEIIRVTDPRVRIARRQIIVIDNRNAKGNYKDKFEVRVLSFGSTRVYGGEPEGVITIQ